MKQNITQVLDRVAHILRRSDVEYAELQSAAIAIVSAICFFFPGQLIDFAEGIRFFCGGSLALVGITQFVGLVKNIHYLRRAGAFVNVVLWFSLVAIFGANERLLAVWSFAFGIGSAWGYVRISKNPHVGAVRNRLSDVEG